MTIGVGLGSATSERAPADRGCRGLTRYLVAAVLTRVADEGARVALVVLGIQRTGSPAVGGGLIAALLVPHVVAAPAVGLLTDRARNPRRVLAPAAAGFAGALALVAVGLGRVPLPIVMAILLAGGCCGPALTGALSSQLPGLVGPTSLPRVFGADALTYNVAGIVGPALAGVLAGGPGAGAATLTLAATAGCGAVALTALPRAHREPAVASCGEPGLTAGVRAVGRDRVLAAVTVSSSLGQLGLGAVPVIAAVIASRDHAPARTGVLVAALAAGALIGSLAWTARPLPARRAPLVVMVALLLTGAPLAAAALTTSSTSVTVFLFAVSGTATGPLTGALFTTRQDHAPDHLRAQVFSVGAGLKTTSAAAGAALAGTLAHTATGTQLLLAGICPLLAGAVGLVSLTRPPPDSRDDQPARSARPP